jgi:hypothetical protein
METAVMDGLMILLTQQRDLINARMHMMMKHAMKVASSLKESTGP